MRQKVLVLDLANSALDAPAAAWAVCDGTGETRPMAGDADQPPCRTGVEAGEASYPQPGRRMTRLENPARRPTA